MLLHFKVKLFFKIRLILSSKLFQLAYKIWTHRSVRAGAKTLDITFGLISAKKGEKTLEKLNTAYVAAAHSARRGAMHESIKQRISILEEIYDFNGIEFGNHEYFAPFLHPSWGRWFGHQSNIFALDSAQIFGFATPGTRYLPIQHYSENTSSSKPRQSWSFQEIVFAKNSHWLKTIPANSLDRLSDFSPLNYLFENSDIIRLTDRFVDIHHLLKIIFAKHNEVGYPDLLPDTYKTYAKQHLLTILPSLSNYEKFAVLHLRESDDPDDAKKVRLENYLDAIRLIIGRGFAVIRIGTPPTGRPMTKLPNIPGLFDFARFDLESHQGLHPYLLTTSEFVLTTHSGLHALPALAGVPVLATNVIGPGFALLERSTGSLSIPKRFELNGKPMTINQLISSNIGYAEMTLSEFQGYGVDVFENSSEEISLATRQLLDELISKNFSENRLASLMKELGSISNGRVPESYFEINPWFYTA